MLNYIMITESAMQAGFLNCTFSKKFIPEDCANIHYFDINGNYVIRLYHTDNEPQDPYFALVNADRLSDLSRLSCCAPDVFRRIARVLTSLRRTRIHLPRHWSEFHRDNLLSFFALPVEITTKRWVTDQDSQRKGIRFDELSDEGAEIDFTHHDPKPWPDEVDKALQRLALAHVEAPRTKLQTGIATEVDFDVIGSQAVVEGLTYQQWLERLTPDQKSILERPLEDNIRIAGPAGSGKTLALCMRAFDVSRTEKVQAKGQRILVATHSWTLADTLDGIISSLNGNEMPDNVIVYPLFSLLEELTQVGRSKAQIIGDDSIGGRRKSQALVAEILLSPERLDAINVSSEIMGALEATEDSLKRIDLVSNIYDEISGVLFATGVSFDDDDSVIAYLSSEREDWMPPFNTVEDRKFVLSIYKQLLLELYDRQSITTDQFILDAIQVLQTFTWRMRKETEGFDYIFVDELQLFNPQERSSLELLGRSRKGVPFTTAEDPSQGVFSALNARAAGENSFSVFLDSTHRFNIPIFKLVAFVYQQFPLNAFPLKISRGEKQDFSADQAPQLFQCGSDAAAFQQTVLLAQDAHRVLPPAERICIVTLLDIDDQLIEELQRSGLPITTIISTDDVAKLTYSKRTIVVSPWQFIGGMQFNHVILVTSGATKPTSQFGSHRENIGVYLSCSRAADTLSIVTSNYTPRVITDALDHRIIGLGELRTSDKLR